jgi:hypothetical protein
MRRYLISILILLYASQLLAQLGEDINDIITDPSVSERCKELIKERNDKINSKQKLKALLKRNEKLLAKTPRKKKSARSKLNLSYNDIKHEIYLLNLNIQSKEENIVRQGCPGIRL